MDNILLKLKDLNVNFLRLGNEDKVHKDIKPYLPLTANQYTSVSVLENIYSSTLIVGTTCLGINHPIFSRRTFDYVIVDEASQLTLPVCLGPLRFGNIFVLVGDHKQLSPVVSFYFNALD